MTAHEALGHDAAGRALEAAFAKRWTDYSQSARRVIDLGAQKKQADAADISDGAASMALDEVITALEKLSKCTL